MASITLPSLAGGEVSPSIGARTDLAKYLTFLSKLENFTVLPFGGVQSRPGLEWVAEVKDSTKVTRLIDFAFSTQQTYVLEFGDLYMRVVKDGGMVLDTSTTIDITGATQGDPCVVTTDGAHGYSNGDEVYISGVVGMTELNGRHFLVANVASTTFELQDKGGVDVDALTDGYTAYDSAGSVSKIFELVTPWAEDEVYDLKFVQSADVMTFCHPDYAPRELTRTDHDTWTLTTITFRPEQEAMTNMAVTAVGTGTIYKYQAVAVNDETAERSLPGLSANTHTITGITAEDPAVVTVSSAHNLDDGDPIYISGITTGPTELNGNYYRAANVGSDTLELRNTSTIGLTAWSAGGIVTEQFVEVSGASDPKNTITWDDVSTAGYFDVFRADDGNNVYGFIGRTETTSFTDNNIDADLGDTPPTLREPFDGAGNYPSTVGYYQQRRIFSNTTNKPQTSWLTQVGNHYNLSTSQPALDDDAITVTLTSRKVNAIKHIVPLGDLIMLTSGSEWLITGENDVISPATIRQEPQTYYGSTDLQPIVVGDVVVYMQPGQTVRDLGYKFETDAYSGNDISILARHLLDAHTVTDWGFAGAPYGQLWCVRDDGLLLCLTYLREQEVFGWSRHTTQGLFKSVAVIREDDVDVPYLIVLRTINGRDVQFIERFTERRVTDVQDATCLDASLCSNNPLTITAITTATPPVITSAAHGLEDGDTVDLSDIYVLDATQTTGVKLSEELSGTGFTVANKTANTFELQNVAVDVAFSETYVRGGYARRASTVLTGLWHLEGHSVTAVANGLVTPAVTVSNGSITLPAAASRVCVGIPYISKLRTLRADIPGSRETVQAKHKKATKLTVGLENSLGFWAGPDEDHMYEAKFGMPAKLGQPRPLVTENVDVTVYPNWNKDGYLCIEQRDPLPLTVLSLTPSWMVGGG